MRIDGRAAGWRRAMLAAALALTLIAVSSAALDRPRAAAQDVEAQALQIEKQLLCPQCTNVRLDHCELAICADMRTQIREQLAEGRSPDDILLFFSNRFGDRVLAELPKEGFNLFLFGWVGGSILLAGLATALALRQLRRTARPAPAGLSDVDQRWLDSQLHEDSR